MNTRTQPSGHDGQRANLRSTSRGPSLIIGLKWWGIGPSEMARSATRSGEYAPNSIDMWDITSRIDRRAMESPIARNWCDRRVTARFRTLLKKQQYRKFDWIAVSSPHRLPDRTLSLLRQHSNRLVAILGDRPVDVRKLPKSSTDMYDVISVPDSNWFSDLPIGEYRCDVSIWGSTLDPAVVGSFKPYVPKAFAVVGTPYPERRELVQALQERGETIHAIGNGWSEIVAGNVYRPMPIFETIKLLRKNELAVINIHHRQFSSGLNPQFSDYAVSAVPQVVPAVGALAGTLGRDLGPKYNSLIERDVEITNLANMGRVGQLAHYARDDLFYSTTLKRAIR